MGVEINSSLLSASVLIFTFYIKHVFGGTTKDPDPTTDPNLEWDYESDLPWWAILLIVFGVLGVFVVLCLVHNKCTMCRGS